MAVNADTQTLRSKARLMKPSVQVGKNGLSAESINEVKKQLKRKGLVKVKFLKSFLSFNDKRETAERIARSTNSLLISTAGFTAVYFKELERRTRRVRQAAEEQKII